MHELTKQLNIIQPRAEKICDSIITSYLREKAEELAKDSHLAQGKLISRHEAAKEILGIEKSEVRLGECEMIKEKTVGEWCEHIQKDNLTGYWADKNCHISNEYNFCPICGTPRPKAKTLAQKFQERCSGMIIEGQQIKADWSYHLFEALEEIATKHFEKESKHE